MKNKLILIEEKLNHPNYFSGNNENSIYRNKMKHIRKRRFIPKRSWINLIFTQLNFLTFLEIFLKIEIKLKETFKRNQTPNKKDKNNYKKYTLPSWQSYQRGTATNKRIFSNN